MTIKKIALSLLASTLVVVSATAAVTTSDNTNGKFKDDGNYTVPKLGGLTIAKELENSVLAGSDKNITDVDIHTLGMDASSATEPNFELRFYKNDGSAVDPDSVTVSGNVAKPVIVREDTNESVAEYSDKDADGYLIFNAVDNAKIDRKTHYVLADKNGTNVMTEANNTIHVDGNVSMGRFVLWANNGVDVLDSGLTEENTYKPQFSNCSIITPLNGLFDAEAEFKKFKTGVGYESNATREIMTLKLTDTTTGLDTSINNTNAVHVVLTTNNADVNLSALVAAVSPVDHLHINDKNITFDLNATDGVNNYTIDFDINGTVAQLSAIDFITNVGYNLNNEAHSFLDGSCVDRPENKWGIYGYYAQIPNVVSNDAKESYINVVNTNDTESGKPIFEILPEVRHTNGDVTGEISSKTCTITAPDAVKPNSTIKYSMTQILDWAKADTTDADCANIPTDATNFAVEVRVPVNPDDIYVNAQQRKGDTVTVLPVYNTSKMTY